VLGRGTDELVPHVPKRLRTDNPVEAVGEGAQHLVRVRLYRLRAGVGVGVGVGVRVGVKVGVRVGVSVWVRLGFSWGWVGAGLSLGLG
jgi:hypothetical protein